MTYVDVLFDYYQQGFSQERAVIVPLSVTYDPGVPIVLAEGDQVCVGFPWRPFLERLAASKVKRFVLSHNHLNPSSSLPRPSVGDLEAVSRIQHMLRYQEHRRLVDVCILNQHGEIFSFLKEGILANPMRDGQRFAEEGARWAHAHHA